MSIRPFRDIKRRKTKTINVGDGKVGGENPITVQSMTNTLTSDVKSTIKQIQEIQSEGADIVRVSCPDESSSKALKEITKHVDIPIVADIHFHYKRAIEAAENGASCVRINPGNIGDKKKIVEVIKSAKDSNCSIRVGVNAGSLEKDILERFKEPCPEALVESAIRNIEILEDMDFSNLKVSVKSSDVFLSVEAYRQLSKKIDYPLHLGITEAAYSNATSLTSHLLEFFSENQKHFVYWILSDSSRETSSFNGAPFVVGDILYKELFSQKESVVLTSATLTSDEKFEHINFRTGFHPD